MKAETTAYKKLMWPILPGREKEKREGRIKREGSEGECLSACAVRDVEIEMLVALTCVPTVGFLFVCLCFSLICMHEYLFSVCLLS